MIFFFLFLVMPCPTYQLDPATFYVTHVEAVTKYDSLYIYERASAIVSPDKLVKQNDVDCLINELEASGLFEGVKAELVWTGSNTR